MEDKHYFTIKEMTYSQTAWELGINNTPTKEIKENIKELISWLDPLREAWGSPIIVSSGYRCHKLNKAVGGSETSVHMIGYAVDLYPKNGRFESFCQFVKEYVQNNDLSYDQIIQEKAGKTKWLHIGLFNNKHQQRKMLFRIDK